MSGQHHAMGPGLDWVKREKTLSDSVHSSLFPTADASTCCHGDCLTMPDWTLEW